MLVSESVPLAGGFKDFFIFTPNLGEDSHFDDHIFQSGWNHQLDQFDQCFVSDGLSFQPPAILKENSTLSDFQAGKTVKLMRI